MDEKLATKLLNKVMGWSITSETIKENIIIQSLAVYRYNEYQQFTTGMRFVESLARWMNQFTNNEKKIAYQLIRKKLVFISEQEMNHLVEITYPDFIHQFLIKKVAEHKGIPEWNVTRIAKCIEFKTLLRQSLFLGLSDGSHIDSFRRNNPQISTEQIFRAHEITDDRAEEMADKLKVDLEKILNRKPTEDEAHFKMIFLLDDFSGSGISYIRYESGQAESSGKVAKFYKFLKDTKDPSLSKLVNTDDVHVCLILYVMTPESNERLQSDGCILFDKIKFDVLPVYLLSKFTKLDETKDSEIISLLKNYKDDSIIDKHFRKGRCCDKSYLGYDECALPLVLYHNTPNNSVPLLWYEDDVLERKFLGLFPRISRHH